MLILFIFLSVAILGVGKSLPVNFLITDAVSLPETLITATPEIPGPEDKCINCHRFILLLYSHFINFVKSYLNYDYLVSIISKKWKYLGSINSVISIFFKRWNYLYFQHLNTFPKYPNPEHLEEFTKNLHSYDEMSKYWIPSQEKLNLNQKINFLKTHHLQCAWKNNSFTNSKNTLGTIYIVRDPRNVLTSIKNHFAFTDEEALNMMLDKNWSLTNGIKTMLSSWGLHYFSWAKNNKNAITDKI